MYRKNDEFNKEKTAENISHFMKSMDYTDKNVADKMSRTANAVTNWRKGRNVPDLVIAIKLARLFKVPVEELIVLKEDTNE